MKLPAQWARFAYARGHYGSIGLELMAESINLVQLRLNDGALQVAAAATVDFDGSRESLIDDPKRLKQLLQPVLPQFRRRQVTSCLPPDFFKLIYINYRLADGRDDATAITQLMRERVDGELDDYVIDYLPVRTEENSGERLALVSVSPRVEVLRYLECLRLAGLEVNALEIGPMALNRLLGTLSQENTRDNSLTITFGKRKSFLSVYSGRRLLLDRELELGEDEVIEQLAQSLDVSVDFATRLLYRSNPQTAEAVVATGAALAPTLAPAEESHAAIVGIIKPVFLQLVEEINKALVYTASQTRGEPIQRIFLLGSAARWPVSGSLLNSLIEIPVHVLYPINRYPPLVEFLHIPPELGDDCQAVATGLALRGMPL